MTLMVFNPAGDPAVGDAECFDPATETFDPAASTTECTATPVEDAEVNPTLIFKTIDQENTTTSLMDDDELRFTVVVGHRYTVPMIVAANSDNDTQNGTMVFTVPSGVTLELVGCIAGIPEGSLDGTAEVTRPFVEGILSSPATIEMIALVNADGGAGEVVFQFRNPDANASGGVTIRAGSMLEVFDLGEIPL